ncbi:hypothetical protein GGQ86_002047 [Xanthobacter flavus]|uniref:Uncharacterized protein n=1 Tax=Xanthobacter flavus TaxID=281 RepID=A0A9W6FI10_XANFL|nr:hypothetical protein [Xanthobacter flavus]MDR6333577.1 hypothetical protein [Xanthobacter flavus]GLI20671.1 hypothetical protein XFLAVUS301_03450 [Xanthobacter flavus]
MADYYPLLVRAISSLPQKTGESRRAVYDRARTALMRQLRGVDPPLPEGEITRERMGLEEAIRRVEAEYAQQDNTPEPPPEDEDEAEEAAPPPPPTRFEPPKSQAAVAAPAEEPESPAEAESRASAEPPARPDRRLPPRQRSEDETEGDRRPPLRRGEVRSRGAAANGGRRGASEGGASWKKFVLFALLALVVLGGIAFAVVNRDRLFGSSEGEQNTAAPAASSANPSDQAKSADRMTKTSGDAARRAPAQRTGAASGSARAVLIEESPGSAQPQTFEGTITWRTETVNAGPGLPPDIGLRGDLVIPERKIAMSFVLRRNTDQTLPASHTIEIGFKLPEDFPFGGVANVDAVRAKPNQQALGTPLAGLAVRVNPTLFLVGLSEKAADRQRNVALLQAYPWLDVLLTYTNNKKAVIAFEKGQAGEQAFNDAFSAWGELLQRPQAPAQSDGNSN